MTTEWMTLSDEEPWPRPASGMAEAEWDLERRQKVIATLRQRIAAAEAREAALREQVRVLKAAVEWHAENCSMPGEAIDALAATEAESR